MKNVKKVTAMLLSIVMLVCCLSMSASASEHMRTVNEGASRFESEWEHTRIYIHVNTEDYIGSLVYGYDTNLRNQDYAWSEGNECKTRAGIRRVGVDDDIVYGSWANIDTYGTYVVNHSSSYVIYSIEFENDYEGLLTGYTNDNTNVNT